MAKTRRSYDAIAASYREHYARELGAKPFDRAFLDELARGVPGRGGVLDLGCGPGHIGAYLSGLGVAVVYTSDVLRDLVESCGLTLLSCEEREPYGPDVEAQTRRAYVMAEKPPDD